MEDNTDRTHRRTTTRKTEAPPGGEAGVVEAEVGQGGVERAGVGQGGVDWRGVGQGGVDRGGVGQGGAEEGVEEGVEGVAAQS